MNKKLYLPLFLGAFFGLTAGLKMGEYYSTPIKTTAHQTENGIESLFIQNNEVSHGVGTTLYLSPSINQPKTYITKKELNDKMKIICLLDDLPDCEKRKVK